MAELSYAYAGIIKSEKQIDGTLKVYGKATDDSLDIDKQICDDEWLKKAMPAWFVSGGNIREQHGSVAAGVATDYENKSDGHYITALIVDPISVKKVETGVLKGFSIGIRGPRVIRDEKAAGGRIVDGQIVEISVVDRPANSNAKMTIAKAADGGELVAVDQTLEEVMSIPTPADAFKSVEPFEIADAVSEAIAEPVAVDAIPEEAPVEEAPVEVLPADEIIGSIKSVVAVLNKFDQAAYDAAVGGIADLIAVEAEEMKNGSDERESIKNLLRAAKHLACYYDGEVEEGEVAGVAPEAAESYDVIELSAKPEFDETLVNDIVAKAVAAASESVASEVNLLKSALAVEKEKATALEAELEVAKSAVLPGGPVRSVITKAVNHNEVLVRIAELRNKAAGTNDRTLAKGYEDLARDLEKSLKGQN